MDSEFQLVLFSTNPSFIFFPFYLFPLDKGGWFC
jgi:hypothetical protein